jgi:ubiquinol-cytochrome c reductase cytochrome b subunit
MMFGPAGPSGEPNPAYIDTAPRPDFYFQSSFAVLALLPPYMETFLIIGFPILAVGAAILLPFLSGGGEKHWSRRPISVLFIVTLMLALSTLTYLGFQSPWSPVMDAWSGMTTPKNYLQGWSFRTNSVETATPWKDWAAIAVQNSMTWPHDSMATN